MASALFSQQSIQKRTLCHYEIIFRQLSTWNGENLSVLFVPGNSFSLPSSAFHLSVSYHSVHFTNNRCLQILTCLEKGKETLFGINKHDLLT